ncbi:ThuA domain-containing protein [Pareuzebyella sediminis]|uniref:ThuA domain-containing protein n=1 Tax=Pareuzebyella sediminis TaxID=2607998 RepID=UPI0011ED5E96|nr:ThuA domain-containing protein [Pareuzebyella sediminis]
MKRNIIVLIVLGTCLGCKTQNLPNSYTTDKSAGHFISQDKQATKIAITGGGGSHDFLKFFGIADGELLSESGQHTVIYTEDVKEIGDLVPVVDILMLTNNQPLGDEVKKTIFEEVNQGRLNLLINHPSTWYNWEDWPQYNRELVGGGSRSHEALQEFEVIVSKPDHPIMKGVPKTFRIVDELYRWERDPQGTDIEVLAVGKGLESGEEFPVVWVVKHPKATIVGNTLGHDERAHDLQAYRTILKNSLEWVKN